MLRGTAAEDQSRRTHRHGRRRKKSPAGAGLKIRSERRSFFTRRLVPIPAQGVGVRDAHVAAPVWAGSPVPFPWLVCTGGPLDVIGRRTGARGIDHPTVRSAPSRRGSARIARRATVFSLLGISLGRSHLRG